MSNNLNTLMNTLSEVESYVVTRLFGFHPELKEMAKACNYEYSKFMSLIKSSRIYSTKYKQITSSYSAVARLPDWLRESISDTEAAELDSKLTRITQINKKRSEIDEQLRTKFDSELKSTLGPTLTEAHSLMSDVRILILKLEFRDFMPNDMLLVQQRTAAATLSLSRAAEGKELTPSQLQSKEREILRKNCDLVRAKYYQSYKDDEKLQEHLKVILQLIRNSESF